MERLSPTADTVKKVTDFLATFGLDATNYRVSKFQDKIHVTMSAKTATAMLRTEFAQFRSALRRDIALPRITQPYYLPAEVADVVSLVDDIMRFPSIRQPLRSYGSEEAGASSDEFASCGTKCAGYTTPAVLQAAYKYSPVTSVSAGNSMSVAEFQYQYYDNTDLKSFSSACGVTATVDTT
jgi:hypothetical protein